MNPSENASPPLAHQIPQACSRLGIGRTALYELMKAGDLRSFKVGTRTLIPESELVRFVTKRMAEAEPVSASEGASR